MPDAARLAIGTLTRLSVPPPGTMDRRTASRAMALAPLVGLGIGIVAAGVLFAGRWWSGGWPPSWLPSALALAFVAAMTGGLHLDGLADTADGLASRRDQAGALAVMSAPEVGALGAASLVLVLLVQVSALSTAVARGVGTETLVLALITGRLLMTLACTRGVPAAKSHGLAAAVAGSVSRRAAGGLVLAVVGLAAFVGWADQESRTVPTTLAVLVGIGAGLLFLRRCITRFGGVTGDVLGATCEVGVTVVLVMMAGAPHAVSWDRLWPP